jgi:hypothetical protein
MPKASEPSNWGWILPLGREAPMPRLDAISPAHHKAALYRFCSNVRVASTGLDNNFYNLAAHLPEDCARSGGFDHQRVCRVAEGTYPPALVALAEARGVQLASRRAA